MVIMSLWIAGMIEQDDQENQVFKVFALPTPPLYRVLLPVLLPGTRCYTDASTAPDSPMQVTRQAGLGIFIVTTQLQTSTAIDIKAKLTNSTSVIMAEAAAVALAAPIVSGLNIQNPFFLSNNQELVSFFDGFDHTTPPQWEIKSFRVSSMVRHIAMLRF